MTVHRSARPPRRAARNPEMVWLLGIATLVSAPLVTTLPLWASLAVATLLGGRALLLRQPNRTTPPRWLVLLGALAAMAAVGEEFHTLFGRAPGVTLLAFLLALKLYEFRKPEELPPAYPGRDTWVVILLACFLLLAQFFTSQSILTALWALTCCCGIVVTLTRLHSGTPAPPSAFLLRRSALLLFLALPFMATLYLLFPRLNGPLWGLPRDAYSAQSGLSDTMAPGSIANLIQSSEIAFRVRFEAPPPTRSQLYFRGPVLEVFDGNNWSALPAPRPVATEIPPQPDKPTFAYTLTLEPHGQRWMLALDYPVTRPGNAQLSPTGELIYDSPVVRRLRYAARSQPDARLTPDETPSMLERALQLPPATSRSGNPRAQALGQTLRQGADRARPADRPRLIAARLLKRFHREDFVYTLTPPLLGANPVDEFLFETKRGFCEHFASAFVVVMRAAGVPARVVTGYQGGEQNPLDGFWVVRQSDAHAWAEIWSPGAGWTRVDPTAAVAPSRVESGLAAAAPNGDPLSPPIRGDWPGLRQLRFRWEAAQNAWNQWVLGYNLQQQQNLLARLGWPDTDWWHLVPLLAGATGTLLLLAGLLAVWPGRRKRALRGDPAERLWQRLCHRLARHGVVRALHEGPADFAKRVAVEYPAWAPLVEEAAACYIQLRFAPPAPTNGTASRQAASPLLRRLRALACAALFRRPRCVLPPAPSSRP